MTIKPKSRAGRRPAILAPRRNPRQSLKNKIPDRQRLHPENAKAKSRLRKGMVTVAETDQIFDRLNAIVGEIRKMKTDNADAASSISQAKYHTSQAAGDMDEASSYLEQSNGKAAEAMGLAAAAPVSLSKASVQGIRDEIAKIQTANDALQASVNFVSASLKSSEVEAVVGPAFRKEFTNFAILAKKANIAIYVLVNYLLPELKMAPALFSKGEMENKIWRRGDKIYFDAEMIRLKDWYRAIEVLTGAGLQSMENQRDRIDRGYLIFNDNETASRALEILNNNGFDKAADDPLRKEEIEMDDEISATSVAIVQDELRTAGFPTRMSSDTSNTIIVELKNRRVTRSEVVTALENAGIDTDSMVTVKDIGPWVEVTVHPPTGKAAAPADGTAASLQKAEQEAFNFNGRGWDLLMDWLDERGANVDGTPGLDVLSNAFVDMEPAKRGDYNYHVSATPQGYRVKVNEKSKGEDKRWPPVVVPLLAGKTAGRGGRGLRKEEPLPTQAELTERKNIWSSADIKDAQNLARVAGVSPTSAVIPFQGPGGEKRYTVMIGPDYANPMDHQQLIDILAKPDVLATHLTTLY